MAAASAAAAASLARARALGGRRPRRSSTAMAAGAEAEAEVNALLKSKVEEMVALQPIMVFSKSWCPFCSKAKAAMQEKGIKFACLELDTLDKPVEEQIQSALGEMTGARSVPRVFIGGKFVGGGDDTVRLAEEGALKDMATEAMKKHKASLMGEGDFAMKKGEDEWKEALGAQQFRILRQRGTERPGSHEYDKFLPEKGHFGCAGCGLPLYSASSKYASTCGWPVFDKIYESSDLGQHVLGRPDGSGALEIVCQRCGSHLGHVFYDSVSKTNPNGERH